MYRRDHVEQSAPDLLDEIHDLVEIGVIGQLQARLVGIGSRRIRLDGARQRQIACDQLFLDRCVFGLEARNLGLERGALVRHGLACPSRRPLRADRHLAGATVKPQIPLIDAVECVSLIVALGRGGLPPSQARYRETQSRDDECTRADHAVAPWLVVPDDAMAPPALQANTGRVLTRRLFAPRSPSPRSASSSLAQACSSICFS